MRERLYSFELEKPDFLERCADANTRYCQYVELMSTSERWMDRCKSYVFEFDAPNHGVLRVGRPIVTIDSYQDVGNKIVKLGREVDIDDGKEGIKNYYLPISGKRWRSEDNFMITIGNWVYIDRSIKSVLKDQRGVVMKGSLEVAFCQIRDRLLKDLSSYGMVESDISRWEESLLSMWHEKSSVGIRARRISSEVGPDWQGRMPWESYEVYNHGDL